MGHPGFGFGASHALVWGSAMLFADCGGRLRNPRYFLMRCHGRDAVDCVQTSHGDRAQNAGGCFALRRVG
jgi:hypothetical protein